MKTIFYFLSLFILLFAIASTYSQVSSEQGGVVGPDVTVGQYITFLKAAASGSDPHGLYSSSMKVQITQSKRENALNYFIAGGAVAEQMMFFCDIMQERRYCNWIEHGAPKNHAEAEASTETGTYDLTGPEVLINPDATHYLYDEIGIIFCIVTIAKNTASPLMFSMFEGRESEEKKAETSPSISPATLRRQSEVDPSQIPMRRNPLFGRNTTENVNLTSQPKIQALPRPPENIPNEGENVSPESLPRSWEEKVWRDHCVYFEGMPQASIAAAENCLHSRDRE